MKGLALQVDYKICGIVLAGGNLISTEAEIFTQMLYADVFRGVHATGVFAKRGTEGIVMAKDAVPSYQFMKSKEYEEVLTGKTATTITPTFIVGHNRHATKGSSGDPKGAHPFQHGNITLVHNGTLWDTSHLPDNERFVVDSENICHSIDKIGAARTIQLLDGAFTLIWHDANDDTVHIIRNDERPFHLAKVSNDWFGASEEDMLLWILTRHKSYKNRKIEHFECEVGVEYVFDVSGTSKKFELKEQIKHNLPTFTYANRYGSLTNGWQRDYGNNNYKNSNLSQAERKANVNAGYNAIAIRHGLDVRVDNRIEFIPTTFVPYSNHSTKGKLMGYFMDSDTEYLEVDVFGVEKQLYDDSQVDLKIMCTGTVQSIIETRGSNSSSNNRQVPRIIVTGVSLVRQGATKKAEQIDEELTQLGDDIPFEVDLLESELDSFRTVGGQQITRAFWMKHDHGICMGCNKFIAWKDAPKAAYAYQAFWHPECLQRVELEEESNREQVQQASDTFICCACGDEKEMKFLDSTSSAIREEDICSACGSEIRRKGLTKEVDHVEASYTSSGEDGRVETRTRFFNRREFESMIRERGSDVVAFKDLAKAKITLRSKNLYAYFYKKEDVKSVIKEETSNNAGNFPTAKYIIKADGSQVHITKARWTQICNCGSCHAMVPWLDVEKCSLNELGKVICKDCRGK